MPNYTQYKYLIDSFVQNCVKKELRTHTPSYVNFSCKSPSNSSESRTHTNIEYKPGTVIGYSKPWTVLSPHCGKAVQNQDCIQRFFAQLQVSRLVLIIRRSTAILQSLFLYRPGTIATQCSQKTAQWQNFSFNPLEISRNLSWPLPWRRTKTWFYTECRLALNYYWNY